MLIIDGKSVPCDVPVHDWNEHGMQFKVGDGARARNVKKTAIDLFVLHWTGGEGGAKACFDVLETRELGVEFCIDPSGAIFQFADPVKVDTFDAGAFNPRSIGVEITNYGFRDDPSQIPSAGKTRALYDTIIRGKARKLAAFYPAQLRAAIALVDACTAAIPTIPRNLPGSGGKLYTGTMSSAQAARYKGVVGHYHLSDNKSDPGNDIFNEFERTGRYSFSNIS